MNDYRALCARMADELDYYRQLLATATATATALARRIVAGGRND